MDMVRKSKNVLKRLQLENGGILATPTDAAYPYVYTRDGVIMAKAFNKLGMHKNAEKFYYFLNKFSRVDKFNEIFHRYNDEGWPCVTRKHEEDGEGLVIHGIYDCYKHSENRTFVEDMWDFVEKLVKIIYDNSKSGLVRTERSIHEFYRLEHGHEIWANSACIRGLLDAAELARITENNKKAKKWNKKADTMINNMKKKMFNKKKNIFVKNTRYPNCPDISQLAPFYFNIIDSKKLLRSTMKYLRKRIWHESLGGFRRFRKFEVCKDWHWYTGGSGSWTVFTIWGARFYRELNDTKHKRECLDFINNIAKKTKGLLPEHIATKDEYEIWKENETEFNSRVVHGMKRAEQISKRLNNNKIYWAMPLGWPHAEYVLYKK